MLSLPPGQEAPTRWPASSLPDGDAALAAGRLRLEVVLPRLALAQPWLYGLVTALGAWMLASLAMGLSRFPGHVAGIGFANVWGLVLLLPLPRRQWPGVLLAQGLGIVSANLAFGDALPLAVAYALPNLVETLLGAAWLRRGQAYRRLTASPVDGLWVLAQGSLLPALASAALAALLLGWRDNQVPLTLALGWFEGAVVGSATSLPLALAVLTAERAALQQAVGDLRSWVLLLVSASVAVLAVLQLPFPFVVVSLPLMLAAVRLRYVVVAALVWWVATIVCTLIAQGLFALPPQTAEWQQIYVYLALLPALLSPLMLAAAVEQARQHHADLSRSRERQRALYERTPAMMFSTDTEGRIVGASHLWLRRQGLRREDVLGRSWLDHLDAPSRRRAVDEVWPLVLATGRCSDVEVRLQRRDGQTIDVLLSATTERDAEGRIRRAHALLEDVTRKRLAEQLAAEHVRSRVTLESIADAVITTDARGRILYLNPVAVTMVGLPEAAVRGRLYGEVLRRRDIDSGAELPDPVALCLHLRQRQHLPQRVRLGHAQGSEHVVQETVSPMFAATGELIGAVAVMRDVTEAHAMALQLAHRAQHDALTGLPNRLLLHDRLVQGLQLARRQRSVLALMYLDMDRFKAVNDEHGHAVGDQLLCQVAERLLQHLRASDTASRLGGDEFVVLLPQVELPEDAAEVAQHLIDALAAPFVIGRARIELSVSVGIAIYPRDGVDEPLLMRHADAAMYQAKAAGRNRLAFFSPPQAGAEAL
jgi:diguanylate cyclase (GGDEF)-like protein/PAS domain S-box-containing protein